MANFGSIQSNTTVTGSGAPVLGTSPALTTPDLGTPSALVGTNISGTGASFTAGKATILATARNIGGVSFDGSAAITVATATGGFTISGGDLALGANNITMTGSLGATAARLTKGWFTDLQVTNAISGSVTGSATTVTGATFTTALTVNTGTLTLTANVANTSVLTIGAGASSISGANTGDQTITLTGAVTGSGTGSFATTFATPGTLTVVSSNSNATAHTHAITSSSAPGAAASILATDSSGIIGSTGTRIVKGWFVDLTVTNAITGAITGNAGTATALATARAINGTNFDGTGAITVTAAAGTLTGATLNSTVTASSLTSVGTLASLTMGGTLAMVANNITITGSIGATGARATKLWSADIESTNMPTVGGTAILTSLTAPQFTTIELGAASDTTLARVSAGVISVEGVTIPTISSTNTVTNKRNQPRITSAASYTTDTGTSLDVSTTDLFIVTAQAGALKFNNPSGTPVQGEKLMIRIKDNGTARALTYDTQFRAVGITLPTTTVISKTLYLGAVFNSTDTKWDVLAVGQEA